MKFEVRLPEKYLNHDVQSVYIHLDYEDYKPMVMLLKENELGGEDEEESAMRIAEQQALAEAAGSSFLQKVTSGYTDSSDRGIDVQNVEPRKTIGRVSLPMMPTVKTQVFYLDRMVPPSPEGHKYYYSLQNPRNFRKETFIDQMKHRMFIEEDPFLNKRIDADASDEEAGTSLPFPKFVNTTDAVI